MQQLSFFADQNIDILFKELQITKEKLDNLRRSTFVKFECMHDEILSLRNELAEVKGHGEKESDKIVPFQARL